MRTTIIAVFLAAACATARPAASPALELKADPCWRFPAGAGETTVLVRDPPGLPGAGSWYFSRGGAYSAFYLPAKSGTPWITEQVGDATATRFIEPAQGDAAASAPTTSRRWRPRRLTGCRGPAARSPPSEGRCRSR